MDRWRARPDQRLRRFLVDTGDRDSKRCGQQECRYLFLIEAYLCHDGDVVVSESMVCLPANTQECVFKACRKPLAKSFSGLVAPAFRRGLVEGRA